MTVITWVYRIDQSVCQFERASKSSLLLHKRKSALSAHTCLTNHTIGRDRSNIITTNWHYHQRLCLEAWHINSTYTPLNHDDGSLLPIYTSSEKGQLISDERTLLQQTTVSSRYSIVRVQLILARTVWGSNTFHNEI